MSNFSFVALLMAEIFTFGHKKDMTDRQRTENRDRHIEKPITEAPLINNGLTG